MSHATGGSVLVCESCEAMLQVRSVLVCESCEVMCTGGSVLV